MREGVDTAISRQREISTLISLRVESSTQRLLLMAVSPAHLSRIITPESSILLTNMVPLNDIAFRLMGIYPYAGATPQLVIRFGTGALSSFKLKRKSRFGNRCERSLLERKRLVGVWLAI